MPTFDRSNESTFETSPKSDEHEIQQVATNVQFDDGERHVLTNRPHTFLHLVVAVRQIMLEFVQKMGL
jgi:hypothetical protein